MAADEEPKLTSPNPAFYRWVVLFLTTGAQSCMSNIAFGVAAVVPFLSTAFSLTKTQVGLLGGAVNLGVALTSFQMGRIVDLYGERVVLTLGLLGTSLFIMVAAAAANSFLSFFVLLLCTGCFAASLTPAGGKAIVKWFPPSQWGFALGVRQTGVPIGGFVAALLLPFLAIVSGWRTALVAAGIIGAAGSVLFFLFYKERSREQKYTRQNNLSNDKNHPSSTHRNIFDNKYIWLSACMGTTFVGSQFILITYMQLFVHEEVGYPISLASKFLVIVQVGGVAGRILWGVISDTLFSNARRPALMTIGFLAGFLALVMLLVGPRTPFWLLSIITFFLGFTAIGWNGLYVALISELVNSDQAGTAIGFGITIIQLGVLFFPPIFGLLIDLTGSYKASWVLLCLLGLLGALLVSRVQELKNPPINLS